MTNQSPTKPPLIRWPFLVLMAGALVFLVAFYLVCAQPLLPWERARQPGRTAGSPEIRGLETHVRALVETFTPRDSEHPEVLKRAALYLKHEFEISGARVTLQPFSVWRKSYFNVIASLGPPSRERVVVGAHYDSFGENSAADDNASGVAGLLELARILRDAPLSTQVDLVAYSLEEPPHFGTENMGSAFHAASLKKEGIAVKAMLSLEMIGYFSDEPGSQRYLLPILRAFYPSRGNFITVVGDLSNLGLVRRLKRSMGSATSLDVRSMNGPVRIPGIDFSDHRSYWAFGYPAAMVTDTAFLRNFAYHTPQDTPDRLDYSKMAATARWLERMVRETCARPARPRRWRDSRR